MDRAHVELNPEGQIEVDVSHLYSWPKGERSQFNDPGAILRVYVPWCEGGAVSRVATPCAGYYNNRRELPRPRYRRLADRDLC